MQSSAPETFKKKDWYYKTGMVSLFYGIATLIVFFALGETGDFVFSQFFQMLIPIPAYIGAQISGSTYVGKQIDMMEDAKPAKTLEKWFTPVGILLGLTLGIILWAARHSASFATAGVSEMLLLTLGGISFTLASIGAFGGFFNRLGTSISIDPNDSALQIIKKVGFSINKEKKAMLIGTGLGLAFSITLWVLGAAALTTVVGVTGFISGGVIPLMGFMFVMGLTSTSASSFDYFSKATRWLKANIKKDPDAIAEIQGKTKEFHGTAIGVTVGLIVATVVIVTLLVTQPYLTALVAAVGIFLFATNAFGGLGSRLGRLMDSHAPKPKLVKIEPAPKPEVTKRLEIIPETPEPLPSPKIEENPAPSITMTEEKIPESPSKEKLMEERDKLAVKILIQRRQSTTRTCQDMTPLNAYPLPTQAY